MRMPTLVIRNLLRRKLATALTGLSVALGVGLFATVGALREASEQGFQRSASISNLVVGAKGDPLRLVLNSLYHMGQSLGNVPYSVYQEVDDTMGVQWAAPIAVGDAFRGHRIVGITSNFFVEVRLGREREPLRYSEGESFSYGRVQLDALKAELAEHEEHGEDHTGHQHFADDHPELFFAVLGSEAARNTGLGVGDSIVPAHGLEEGAIEQHEEAASRIIGVLEPTGTPIDRAIYVPLGSYYIIDDHQPDERTEAGGARDPRGISAILVQAKPGFYAINIWRNLNDRLDAQAAKPPVEIKGLFELIGTADRVLSVVSMLVVIVALIGVMVAIYNTMGARRKEFAVLRALGARRSTVLGLVTAESAAIALFGGLAGMLLAGILLALASGQVQELTGVSLTVAPGLAELQLLGAVTLAGALAGLVPAWSAYRTEAAHHLSSGL